MIESISAVTLKTQNMSRAISFYQKLGFELNYGGEKEAITSFHVGPNYLNLIAATKEDFGFHWGRIIFYVSDVDEFYQNLLKKGLKPEFAPKDASWGERYFHIKDPDGHELSFARPLS